MKADREAGGQPVNDMVVPGDLWKSPPAPFDGIITDRRWRAKVSRKRREKSSRKRGRRRRQGKGRRR